VPGLVGSRKQLWNASKPKGSSPFPLSLMARWHQSRPRLCECWPGQPTAAQTCSWNVPRSQNRLSLLTPLRLKVTAHSDPMKGWKFRKAHWKRFCLLTGESVVRLPSPDTTNIEKAHQDFSESLLLAAKQSIPRGRCKNYVPCSGLD